MSVVLASIICYSTENAVVRHETLAGGQPPTMNFLLLLCLSIHSWLYSLALLKLDYFTAKRSH